MSQVSRQILAGLISLALTLVAAPASAQDNGSIEAGNAKISFGTGTAILMLPDINFTIVEAFNFNTTAKQENSDFDDAVGWNVNGAIEIPTLGPNGIINTTSLKGFYSSIEDDDTVSCQGVPGVQRCGWMTIIDVRLGKRGIPDGTTSVNTNRDVAHWGTALEFANVQSADDNRQFVAAGLDFRSINQDISIFGLVSDGFAGGSTLQYDEDLDTRYYGLYVAAGSDYSLPFLGSLWSQLGLQSSIAAQVGVYFAHTEYRGHYIENRTSAGSPSFNQTLSLSRDDTAIIASLTHETRKRIGRRSTISLKSEVEWYSSVPDMAYVDDRDAQGAISGGFIKATNIEEADAFSMRTSLRLNISLGGSE